MPDGLIWIDEVAQDKALDAEVVTYGTAPTSRYRERIQIADDVASEWGTTKDLTVLASAARTATVDSPDQANRYASGVMVVVDVTAIVTAPSIVVKIQAKDVVSGRYIDLLVSAAITTVSTVALRIGRGLTAVANLTVNDALPRSWRIRVEHANANSITYSVGASLIP